MTDEFTYKSQDIHYLGFLEAQLRDMQGIDLLAYELIQNADDAPAVNGRIASITFDVTDDALLVSNDGVFRPEDFARLQTVASGGKREERGVTGAFGLGFLAVYQITDRPEIFSSGRHWTIYPDAPAEQRIVERQATTEGTTLRLPWAFDPHSAVRRALRLSAVQAEQLDDFAAQLGAAVGLAALFLRQLHSLEVRRNGELVRRLTRQLPEDNGRITLQNERGELETWLLLQGDFAAAAAQLRAQYAWQIEEGRRTVVQIALPVAGQRDPGRLFAGLPTATTTPLPLHLNADFFPTTDRKRIHFDGGYQAEWNHAALRCAAQLLAAALPTLPALLGAAALWRLLAQMAHADALALSGDLPSALAVFWQTAVSSLPDLPLVLSSQQSWLRAADVRLWEKLDGRRSRERLPDVETAVSLLTALDIPLVHPDLAPYFGLLRRPEIGVPDLAIADIADALQRQGLTRKTALFDAPPHLRTLSAWQTLWRVLDELLGSATDRADRDAALAALSPCALILSEEMVLQRPGYVYQGNAESQALFPTAFFPAVAWLHPDVAPHSLPGRLSPRFGARQAVDLLAETAVDRLQADWQYGRLDIPRLFHWLEGQQIEIFADDPTLRWQIRRLPLCPVDGELRPLNELYLPGGFADPLQLAGFIDLEAVGGRRQFLQDLGVAELDFAAYVHDVLPRVLTANADIPSDARHRLVQLLAQRLGELRDDELLQEQLSRLPLVACLDGSFRAATAVYASRDVMTLLGEQIHVAEPVTNKAVAALHRWLGVRQQPTAADLVAALLDISQRQPARVPLSAKRLDVVQGIWQRLADLPLTAETAVLLTPLQQQPVIPNGQAILMAPDRLCLVDQPQVAARFGAAAAHLLTLPQQLAPIMAAVGVRPLAQLVAFEIVTEGPPLPAVVVQERLRERHPLLVKLLRAEGVSAPVDWLLTLPVWQAARMETHDTLTIGAETWTAAAEVVTAKWVPETAVLYAAYAGDDVPWTAVARELALALRPQQPPGGLALG
ncbi:MAG: DUF3684 domain-containing protein, partial [Anaerolineales bacterium]|nr:DUF3684 domain-containing protein [Anaerolineales bacterium]